MDATLAGLKWNCVQVYLDDALIASPSFEQHLIDLTAVLFRFKEAGFKLKASKCHFFCSEVEYLGHLITRNGIRANPQKIETIKNWSIPENATSLASFLGLAGYYRKLIKNFAQKESSLRKVLLPNVEFIMGPDQIRAFKELQDAIISDPILALPDFSGNSKFELHTDASDLGISAILVQIGPDGQERVIHYGSRMLTKQELKYHTQEKEALAIVWGLNKFRPYLIGSRFIVRTDHHSLQWLMKAEKGRLARWAVSLQEFDFELVHRAGKKNINADVLSRYPNVPADPEWSEIPSYSDPANVLVICKESDQQICGKVTVCPVKAQSQVLVDLRKIVKDAQQKDKIIQELKFMVQSNTLDYKNCPLLKGFVDSKKNVKLSIYQDVLCRVVEDNKQNIAKTQVIVPNDPLVITKIIQLNHDTEWAGHLGNTRTLHRVLRYFFWPSVRHDCKHFVKHCHSCQIHKGKIPSNFVKSLQPSLPTGPNIRLGIDLIGPLPKTKLNNTYCLTMMDHFTKWNVVVPLKNKEEGEVANAIYNQWYCKYGIPFELQSDQGNEFTNDLLKRINSRLSVGHRVTTPYYPLANGLVERYNQTFKNMMSIYAESHPVTWDEFVNGVSWAYNSSLNPQTGFSPYYLMFGREPRLPVDVFEGSLNDIQHDLVQYQTNLTAHLRNAHEIVKSNLKKNAISMKLYWDDKIRSYHQFKKDDKVLMYFANLNTKEGEEKHAHVWNRQWIGPFTIIGQKYPNNKDVYLIKDNDTQREWTVNVHKLRPYHGNQFLNNIQEAVKAPQVGHEIRDRQILLGEQVRDAGSEALLVDDRTYSETNLATPDLQLNVIPPDIQSDKKSKKHKNAHRHETGITVQESKRIKVREKYDSNYNVISLDAFKEHEIDKVIDSKNTRNGYQYLVKWKNIPNPTWEPFVNFNTKECIQDYWNTQPIGKVPRKFKETAIKNQRPLKLKIKFKSPSS
jgi:hypothetical protein